ncbi:MAG: bacillithiol system redox-active protein YtxJ [Crocinitomicaceae bacterium]|nr:bacillithiol system redox-active protein YtxJ [Crocinitomicaceae bacterium]
MFSRNSKKELPWTRLTSVEQLHEILNKAEENPILFFKHSTRCATSMMVLRSFESSWSSDDNLCELYFLDLLKHRDVSNEISARTGVVHQSPQVIVLRGNSIVYENAHSGIDANKIESLLIKG